MTATRSFHLGDILSITTGLLVSPGHIAAVHELLDFMTGDILFTHQLPRAADECKPALLAQHPDLATVEVPEEFDGKEHVDRWLAEQVQRFGEHRDVAPLAPEDHTRINPLTELAMHYPDKPVIAVDLGEPHQ
jgi:hypothetical protein